MTYANLAHEIRHADLCLGIFGNNKKAALVIPNKIVEALASAKPVITVRTPASEELLVGDESVLYCQPADPADLAEKILILKNNNSLAQRIAAGGNAVYTSKLTPKIIAEDLIKIIKDKYASNQLRILSK